MKLKHILGIVFSVVVMVGSMAIPALAAEDNASMGFEYPLQPDMEEWGKLNHGERVLESQIPEDVLKQMTTDELVTTVLNYPCFIDMIFYNTYQEGFEVVRDNFNGLQELLDREDSGVYLLDAYKSINLLQLLSINDEDKDLIGYKLEYESLEVDGVKKYRINGDEYPFVKRVSGRSENAKYNSYYVVLTSDAHLTFEDVDSQFWGSNLSSDIEFIIVEYGLVGE